LEYTAIGDSVNTAKRLQENAAPGQILISSEACELTRDSIITAPITPLKVKGKKQLIHGYEITDLIANYSD
jgi:adenylate cyclase